MAKGKNPKSGAKKPGPSVVAPPLADTRIAEKGKSGKAKPPSPLARIFPVDTRFQQLARRSGGMPRDKAIERAQAALEGAQAGL